jgi:hypothetical protein
MPRFLADFPNAIDDEFDHYYAVSRKSSKVTVRQFEEFCRRIGAPLHAAPDHVVRSFEGSRVEKVYRVREPVFNARLVRDRMVDLIREARSIDVLTGTTVFGVRQQSAGLVIETSRGSLGAKLAFNTTYSSINAIQRGSGLPLISLQHELAEMALVDCTDSFLVNAGITIMDGPFFSILPFPDRGLHTLSHVRYTPHARWTEGPDTTEESSLWSRQSPIPPSNFTRMRADVARHIPSLRGIEHKESLWEVKTVLPQSSRDDSRPILYRAEYGLKGYTVVLGGKLDNVYDALEEMGRSDEN